MKISYLQQLVLISVFSLLLGCESQSELVSMRLGDASLEVEMADTPELRQKGLQKRQSLPENRGMLFLFPVARELSFWSKETYIPLSLAFINDSGKIVQIVQLPPEQLEPVVSELPVRYALEVNSGWFEKNQVGVGDTLRMER